MDERAFSASTPVAVLVAAPFVVLPLHDGAPANSDDKSEETGRP